MLSPADIARLRGDHRLVDVLGRAGIDVAPSPSGRDFLICCPMPAHDDSTPSMIIHLDTNRYHCFGCGAHGDVLQFVMGIEQITSLTRAAELLDSRQEFKRSVTGPRTSAISYHRLLSASEVERPDLGRTSAERVLEVNDAAWEQLTVPTLAERARAYLLGRRIDVCALEADTGRPLAGHSPWSDAGLVDQLRQRGFAADELVDAGWASRRAAGTLTDRFRRRVLFPARDVNNRVIGVYGRDVTGRTQAKYVNTSQTAVFRKGGVLYRPSRLTLDRQATVVVCEGALDALSIAAAASAVGRSTSYAPVSPSGTAFTIDQARAALGIHPRPPVLCGDGDPAGQAATAAWATTIIGLGRECLATLLPDMADPADWLARYGTQGLVAFTRQGRHEAVNDGVVAPIDAVQFIAGLAIGDMAEPSSRTASQVLHRLGVLGSQLSTEPARHRFAVMAGIGLAGNEPTAAERLAHKVSASIAARLDGCPRSGRDVELRAETGVGI